MQEPPLSAAVPLLSVAVPVAVVSVPESAVPVSVPTEVESVVDALVAAGAPGSRVIGEVVTGVEAEVKWGRE